MIAILHGGKVSSKVGFLKMFKESIEITFSDYQRMPETDVLAE